MRVTDKLSCPVTDIRILVFQFRLQLLSESFYHLIRLRRKRDDFRLLRILILQHISDLRLVGKAYIFRDRRGTIFSATDIGSGDAIQESRRKTTPTEGIVLHQTGQDARLRHEKYRQRRVHNTFAASADSVDFDGISGVPFEHYIDVDIFRIDSGEGIEDTALCGDDCGSAVIIRQDLRKLFRSYIVHGQPERFFLLKSGKFPDDAVKFSLNVFSLGSLILKSLLPPFQNTTSHLAGFDLRRILHIGLGLKYIDRSDHGVLDSGFSFGRLHDVQHESVHGFIPVSFCADLVFALNADRDNWKC